MYSKGLAPIAAASVVTLTAAFAMVFFYAPNDADQGFIQKIFYVHVPMAIVALGGFVAGGVMAIRHLRSGDRSWDVRSYVAIIGAKIGRIERELGELHQLLDAGEGGRVPSRPASEDLERVS